MEGLGTDLIGAYGSSTAQTAAIDRLASYGVLLDQCFLDSQELPRQLRSLWTGLHDLQPKISDWCIWNSAGARLSAQLFTDSEEVADLASEYGCDDVTFVKPVLPSVAAMTTSDCALMPLFAAAAEELSTAEPGLVWIHSQGMRLPWDAPITLRNQFADPEDPDPPHEAIVPSICETRDVDPDWLVGWAQVAAAQATVIDECLSGLMETVEAGSDAAAWSWLLTSLGGVPLGQHGQLGWGRKQLHGEELHLATVVSPANPLPIGVRRPELFQLPDVAATVAALLGLDFPVNHWGRNVLANGAAESPVRWPNAMRLAMIATEVQTWIRSPAWSALLDNHRSDASNDQLFVKPEDRWEVSQVADRRRDIVEQLRQQAELFRSAAQQNDRGLLTEIDEELINLLR